MKLLILVLGVSFLMGCGRSQVFDANANGGGSSSKDFSVVANSMAASADSEKLFFCFPVPNQNGSQPQAPGAPLLCQLGAVTETSFQGSCFEGVIDQSARQIAYGSLSINVPFDDLAMIVSPDTNEARDFFENPPYKPLEIVNSGGSITVQNPAGQSRPDAKDVCIPFPKK